VQKGVNDASSFDNVNTSYNKILDSMNEELALKCEELIFKVINENCKYNQLSEDEKSMITFLKELKYVDIKEIANEIWHQIFGATNEYLVKEGFVSSPPYTDGEGRYLRSFVVNDI
jgi:hypothetical protein